MKEEDNEYNTFWLENVNGESRWTSLEEKIDMFLTDVHADKSSDKSYQILKWQIKLAVAEHKSRKYSGHTYGFVIGLYRASLANYIVDLRRKINGALAKEDVCSTEDM